jgi:glycosyltransferase involved in cell wall biosynthesis
MIASACPRLRILLVIDDMGVGGAQKQVAEVANRLDKSVFEVDVACIERGGASLDRLAGVGAVHVLGARRLYDNTGVAAAARLARIIRRGRYDLVEAYLPAAHLLSALALGGRRRPALVAARRHMASLDPSWMAAASILLNRVTLFSIANSRAVKASVAARYAIAPSRIAVIPNILDLPAELAPRETARRGLGLGMDEFIVAAAGTLVPVKDYPTILRSFAQAAAGRRARLVVAGGGPGRKALEALKQSIGLNGNVTFLGETRRVADLFAAADAFVHASRSEGLSNSLLEAMAAGLPAACSDIPANREAAGDCAAYFRPGDAAACGRALALYMADPRARRAAGEAARLRVARMYGERVIRRRERLYLRLTR